MKPYEPSSLCTGLGDYWIIWRCDSCSYSCLLLVSPLSHQILHQNSGWLPNSYIHRDQSISPLNGAFCQIALFCWPPDQVVWCWLPLADDAGDNSNTDQAAFNLAMLTAGKSQVSEWCYMYESVLDLAEVESVFITENSEQLKACCSPKLFPEEVSRMSHRCCKFTEFLAWQLPGQKPPKLRQICFRISQGYPQNYDWEAFALISIK